MHFENLWEESEELSHSTLTGEDDRKALWETLHSINENLNNLTRNINLNNYDGPQYAEHIGEILYGLTFLSKEFNVNVYAALFVAMNNKKVEDYG